MPIDTYIGARSGQTFEVIRDADEAQVKPVSPYDPSEEALFVSTVED